jgi:sterol 24-C-methyltransferase
MQYSILVLSDAYIVRSSHAKFDKVLHGKTSQAKGGISSILGKDQVAQKAAVDEHFNHWDNRLAEDEAPE